MSVRDVLRPMRRQPSSSSALHHQREQIVGRRRGVAARADLARRAPPASSGNAPRDALAALGRARAPARCCAAARCTSRIICRAARRGSRARRADDGARQRVASSRHEIAAARARGSGRGAATLAAASTPRPRRPPRGVKPFSSRRRIRGCSGASISPRKLSSSGTRSPGARMSPTDENVFASRKPLAVSSYFAVNTRSADGRLTGHSSRSRGEECPVLRLRLIHHVEGQVVVGHRVLRSRRRRATGEGVRAGAASRGRATRASP